MNVFIILSICVEYYSHLTIFFLFVTYSNSLLRSNKNVPIFKICIEFVISLISFTYASILLFNLLINRAEIYSHSLVRDCVCSEAKYGTRKDFRLNIILLSGG